MQPVPVASLLLLSLLHRLPGCMHRTPARIQTRTRRAKPAATEIAPDAPKMTRQTRLEIIRDFETQIVYSRTSFPMGAKGLNCATES